MTISERILLALVDIWPSPVKARQEFLGDPSTEQYHLDYATKYQFDIKVKYGIGLDVRGKDVLEIGCGHGGIACFLAVNGAKSVVGIDINDKNLGIAKKVKAKIEHDLGGANIPVTFTYANAASTGFPDESYDIIIADNVFEHFSEPETVLKECYRLLRKGGIVSVPSLPSYYSKYGLHLKIGFKVPWANLLFSERTICKVVGILAERDASLLNFYPGVKDNPRFVRDLRAFKDLNGMTYKQFKRLVIGQNFRLVIFRTSPTPRILGPLVSKIPILKTSIFGDIFSSKSTAVLIK